MKVLYISVECYLVVKVGGFGDVVGVFFKYFNEVGLFMGVVIFKYCFKWFEGKMF